MKTFTATLVILMTLSFFVPNNSYSLGVPGSRQKIKVLNKKRKLGKETSYYSLKFSRYNFMEKNGFFSFLKDNRRHIH